MENKGENDHNPSHPPLILRGGDRRKKNSSTWSALSLAWELGYTIAIPIVALALAGRWLDKKLDSSPWLLLIGILLSILISSWLVCVKTVKIIGK